MATYVTGDIHGVIDIGKLTPEHWPFGQSLHRCDYLLIVGDFGLLWSDPPSLEERYFLSWLDGQPWTTLFVDGNHENHDLLDSLPVTQWHGGNVHVVPGYPHIIHLMRGQVFNIGGTTFFTFGGAYSIDREGRIKGRTWFPEELPNEEEYAEGWRNLKKHGFEVDYILTHTAPAEIIDSMGYYAESDEEDELRQYLQRVAENTEFRAWYFGHFHEDSFTEDKFFCLYDDIIEL